MAKKSSTKTKENKKKQSNDQGEIIKLLKKKEWNKVWEQLKWVGYSDEKDINRRYIIFRKACNEFNPKINNNFILFYKRYLRFLAFDKDSTFVTTTNYRFIKELKNENISPTENPHPMVEQLKKINP